MCGSVYYHDDNLKLLYNLSDLKEADFDISLEIAAGIDPESCFCSIDLEPIILRNRDLYDSCIFDPIWSDYILTRKK